MRAWLRSIPAVLLVPILVGVSDTARQVSEQEERQVPRVSPAASTPAVPSGFHYTVSILRATSPSGAREQVERAIQRLRRCCLARAEGAPTLTLVLLLRLGVTPARADGGEGLLSVKVTEERGLERVRGCVEALELLMVPARLDFDAVARISYGLEDER